MAKMTLIGLFLNLAAITYVFANSFDKLRLSLSEETVVRYTNQSLIVQCLSPRTDLELHWKSPKGEIIQEQKGRVHIEQSTPGNLKIIFANILFADKGIWNCEAVEDRIISNKSFELIVYQKITFTENATILTVKEGRNATILCEVKGEPQPNVTWHFNGQPITIDLYSSKFRILADGLLINKVTQNDTGEYTCRAFQVTSIASDMQERTVLMKIEHKPHWTHKHHLDLQYAYINGTTTIHCDAIAEPPANFTWHRSKKRLQNDSLYYTIQTSNYWSTLTIFVHNQSIFDNYRCRVQNSLGIIERTTSLRKGEKPTVPEVFQLRGFNSNTFDIDIGSVRSPQPERSPMEINGFRIEFLSEFEFKSDAGKWINAKRKDFPFEDGATFLISNLESNTTYLMRAASRNLAGYSDWTKVEKFHTLSNEPPSSAARLWLMPLKHMCLSLAIVLMSRQFVYYFSSSLNHSKIY